MFPATWLIQENTGVIHTLRQVKGSINCDTFLHCNVIQKWKNTTLLRSTAICMQSDSAEGRDGIKRNADCAIPLLQKSGITGEGCRQQEGSFLFYFSSRAVLFLQPLPSVWRLLSIQMNTHVLSKHIQRLYPVFITCFQGFHFLRYHL